MWNLDLLRLVCDREPDPRMAYAVLEQVWRDLGFDESSDAPGQAELEFAMERLWHSCPAESAG